MNKVHPIAYWLVAVLAAAGPFAHAQHGTVSTAGTGTAGVHILSDAAFPDVVVKTGNTTTSAFRIFNFANVELLRVSANGNIGIGTTNPGQKLEIFNGTTTGGAVVISTPLAASFPANSQIGGLRLAWKFGGSAANNVDLQVVRGLGSIDGAGLAISTSPSNAQTVERMRITSAGRVGIGEPAPTARLMVHNDVANIPAFLAQQYSGYSTNADSSDIGGMGLMRTSVATGVTQSGTALGHSGLSYLEGAGTLQTAFGLMGYVKVTPGHTGSINNAYGVWAGIDKFNGLVGNGYGLYVGDIAAANDYGIFQAGQDDSNYFAGDVTVGPSGVLNPGTKLTVNGNVVVSGSITGASVIGAKYQDIAEWVPASSDLEPGTVVVLDAALGNGVMASTTPYDTSVAGVVSAQPGIILGEGGASKEQIATTGRVRVKVDATRAPIAVGDLLVTSDNPGYAMRSIPVDVAGIAMHRPGTIVGKALEALASGEGEVLVLLSLQ